MKKASVANLIIIIGLLVFSVMTLIAVYATAPESSVLLLEETFDGLDGNKWIQGVSDCSENDEQFRYVTANEESGLISDGVLHIYPNLTEVHFRTKRQAGSDCYSCVYSENSTSDCISSRISAKLRTRNPFYANQGRVEIRAKLCCGDQIKFSIGITPNQNNSHPPEVSEESLPKSENATDTSSAELRVFFESDSNQTIMESSVADDEYHVYKVNWDEEKITLHMDGVKIDEKRLKENGDLKEESISNTTVKLDSAPVSKPLYLDVGVEFAEKEKENRTEVKRSLDSLTDLNSRGETNVMEVDYIKIFKILN